MAEPTVRPFGDAALLVTVGDDVDVAMTVRAHAIAGAIQARRRDVAAERRDRESAHAARIQDDPLALDRASATAIVEATVRDVAGVAPPERPSHEPVQIRVRYGGEDGPDLEDVAEQCGLRPVDVVERHAAARYRVLFLGFAPGFAYLGGLPPELATPRRPNPRERVPAGSVGIAGEQTGIYPLAMPGGWNLIGRTDATLFDPARSEPSLLEPGATVRFVPERR